ncbi:energy transducer TonB [Brumimicrobium aurantiacum]|uniref:Energy transducer TonB n=1 Tax=Brumimicrobium aurantiacum TaxID=1737063 RepID=A0A3E1EX46_9FLAO|nr:energy transducer TonB [Brumimicrobium aurantiacum]RFC54088.1 energy transducer TonB [Brumimicrobium aurantiacum]
MMKRKNPKLDLESKRKVFFQLGLFIVGSATLMAFTYRTPVEIKEKKLRVEEAVDLPVMIEEKEAEPIVEVPKVVKVQTRVEPTTPVFSLDLLNQLKKVKNTNKNTQLAVTSKQLKSITSGNFDVDPGPAPELGKVVDFPDYDAQFQGNWRTFLSKTLVYPEMSIVAGESGTAYVGFVVEVDGTITDVEVKNKSLPYALQKEAKRVVKSSPKWKPGIKDGEYVRSTKIVKINFILQ